MSQSNLTQKYQINYKSEWREYQKFYTKAYYIICLLYKSTHVEFNKINFLSDFLYFFKDSTKINIQ
jgi:hypothetical protein